MCFARANRWVRLALFAWLLLSYLFASAADVLLPGTLGRPLLVNRESCASMDARDRLRRRLTSSLSPPWSTSRKNV